MGNTYSIIDDVERLQSEIEGVFDGVEVVMDYVKMVPYSKLTQEQYIRFINAMQGMLLSKVAIMGRLEAII